MTTPVGPLTHLLNETQEMIFWRLANGAQQKTIASDLDMNYGYMGRLIKRATKLLGAKTTVQAVVLFDRMARLEKPR